jgi:photosystem II stability/assembly factor-like uncharacterized protein
MRGRRVLTSAAMLVAAGLVLVGCASGSANSPLLGRPQQIVMTSPTSGYAVWPSGVRWVVISTTDGWRTVTNRTPLAVPTDGGMVLAATPQSVVTGVLPFHLLTVSPVLTSSDQGKTWAGSQLPGALLDSPYALARIGTTTYAILAKNGNVVAQTGGRQWSTVVDPATLASSATFKPQGITTPDGTTLVLFGSGANAGQAAFASTDAGASWKAIPLDETVGAVTADAPCSSASGWLIPVRTTRGLVVDRGAGPAGPFTATPVVVPASNPVVACGGGLVWIAVTEGDSTKLVTVGATGTANSLGQVSGRITDLAPTGATTAVVATSDISKIGTLTTQPSLQLTMTPLPTWVATVGGPAMRD